jgi:hypothetical protein
MVIVDVNHEPYPTMHLEGMCDGLVHTGANVPHTGRTVEELKPLVFTDCGFLIPLMPEYL